MGTFETKHQNRISEIPDFQLGKGLKFTKRLALHPPSLKYREIYVFPRMIKQMIILPHTVFNIKQTVTLKLLVKSYTHVKRPTIPGHYQVIHFMKECESAICSFSNSHQQKLVRMIYLQMGNKNCMMLLARRYILSYI